MVNFPFICDTEIAEIYRNAYNIGQGKINVDDFIAVTSENGFFIKYL